MKPTAALALASLTAAVALAGCSSDDPPSPRPTPAVSTSPLPGGLQRIVFQGATVDVPDDWEPIDCGEFTWTQLGPAGPGPCGGGAGVAFYASATFDPADGPGVVRRSDQGASALWGGYEYGGDWAVYVQTPSRGLTRQVLGTVR